MIKERPILMSAPMVRAILESRKTQTRRIVKSKSDLNHYNKAFVLSRDEYNNDVAPEFKEKIVAKKPMALFFRNFINDLDIECPYGNVGERLWVRETFFEAYNDRFLPTGEYCYAANHQGYVCVLDEDGGIKTNKDGSDASPWKPSIHMPRKASRILLEITGIRIERLQDISEDDAIAEGILFNGDYELWWDYQREQWICVDPIDSYKSLICKINGPETWEKNPWVWVVEFKVIEVKGGSHENDA